MILVGDIIKYFNHMHIDVEESSYEDTTTFTFHIYFKDFDLDASFSINHETNLLLFLMGMENPENLESMPEALNAINQNSSILKAYYERLDDACFIKASSFVLEDNVISVMDYILTCITDIDALYIENLYYTLYNPDYENMDDDEFEESHKDTSIEEDMEELLSLLSKK